MVHISCLSKHVSSLVLKINNSQTLTIYTYIHTYIRICESAIMAIQYRKRKEKNKECKKTSAETILASASECTIQVLLYLDAKEK